VKQFNLIFPKIKESNKTPLMVGGTGLYLSSILQKYKLRKADFSEKIIAKLETQSTERLVENLKNLNPKLHNTTDLLDRDRIIKAIVVERSKEFDNEINTYVKSFNIGIKEKRETIKERINLRLKHRLNNGMIDEVKNLMNSGISYERLKLLGLEYKFIAMYLNGELNYNDMYQKLDSSINNFAKRQMTWFRKMEKEGCVINWIDGADFDEAKKLISRNYFNE